MAKRPPRGKCVHCLADNVERTWDHVFPRAWYPHTTPANLYKWQIPSCHPCNNEYGELEDDLLFRLAMCVDPHVRGTAGIVPRALRSMKPEFAKNARDRAARAARLERLRGELLDGPDIPRSAVYPGLGERWGRPMTEGLGVRIPAKSFRRLTDKIVRGIYFLDSQKFIEPPYAIEFYALSDEGAGPLRDLLARSAEVYAREPGILVRRALAQGDLMSGVFEITIWAQFCLYASVHVPEP
jgi:hypothetical protein